MKIINKELNTSLKIKKFYSENVFKYLTSDYYLPEEYEYLRPTFNNKLDKMLFEVSRYNSLESGEVKELPALAEMDELIKNANLYK